jgi:hypothetical protein
MFMRVNSKCAHQVRPPLGRPAAVWTVVVVGGFETTVTSSLSAQRVDWLDSECASHRPEGRQCRNRDDGAPIHGDDAHHISLRYAVGDDESDQDTQDDLRHRAAKQHSDHVPRPPAQRDANAHLSRSLRGGEGEDRVNAGQRQKHNDERQGQEEPEEQRHGAGTCGSDLIEAGDLRDLKRGLDISGDGPQA